MNNLETSAKTKVELYQLEVKRIPLKQIAWVEEYEGEGCELPRNFIESINRLGVKIAIGVQIIGGVYCGIYGRRRWLACQKLNRSDIPAVIYGEDLTDAEVAAIRLIENLQRNGADPIQVGANCYRYLADKLGVHNHQEAIDKLLCYGVKDRRLKNKDVEAISTLENHTRKSYPSKMQRAISEKEINLCAGYLLAEQHDNPRLEQIYGAALHGNLSVANLERLINKLNGQKIDDTGLVKKCTATIKRLEAMISEVGLTQAGVKNVLEQLRALCTSIEKYDLSKNSDEQMVSKSVDEVDAGETQIGLDNRGTGDE
jgi:hypothetical protein